jgi:4-amino-4-deoxy-L-arabinose transferase-like glycosyltransferase
MLPVARFLKIGACMPITTVGDASGLGAETRCVRKYMRGSATTPWGISNCTTIALVLILMLGAGLRFYNLSVNPVELFGEEIDTYLSVRSIVTTGKDIDGRLKPFLATPYERHGPIYGIASYLSSLVFGNGAFGLRFPAALFGIVSIALLYGIAFVLTRRRGVALVTALFIAITPLFIHFSRIGWITDSMLPFLLGGLYALLCVFDPEKADQKLSFKRFLPAAILLAAAVYTYHAAWFYVIALGGALLIVNFSRFRSIPNIFHLFAAMCLWGALVAPALWELYFDPQANWRFHDMATFKHGVSVESIQAFASHYSAHFSWSYLVATGMENASTQRELAGFGGFYWWMVPLLIAGAVGAGRILRTRWMLVWVYLWLLVYPLGGAFVHDGNAANAGRTLAGAPILCIFAALGLAILFDFSKIFRSQSIARGYLLVLCGFFLVNVVASVVCFCAFYFVTYPRLTAQAWESGTKELFERVRAYQPRYARICIGGFGGITQHTYVQYYIGDLSVAKIENIDDPACFQPGTLLISPSENARPGFTTLASAMAADGSLRGVIQGRAPLP